MKILITILLFSFCVFGQKVEVDQSFVDDAAKAFALVVSQRELIAKQEKQIEDLQKLVAEIEKSQRTPCTIAQEKVKNDLVFWLGQLTGSQQKDREVLKILKDIRKQGQKALASQCDYTNESQFMTWLKITAGLAPLLIFLK